MNYAFLHTPAMRRQAEEQSRFVGKACDNSTRLYKDFLSEKNNDTAGSCNIKSCGEREKYKRLNEML